MKTMKRILSLMLSLGLLAALAACGAQPEPAEPSARPTERPEPTAQTGGEARELAAPVYPTETEWHETDTSGADAFAARSLPVMFAGLNGENRVYSPLNIYMALGMLAEITDGESRAQILALLGEDGIEGLRATAKALFEAAYSDEDWLTLLPAASVWLRDGEEYRPEALQQLAENYYAAAFSGPMGAESYNRALRDWINERTNHLLEQQAESLSLSPETMIALVTTLYFKGSWSEPFPEGATQRELFHADVGDKETDFMRRSDKMYYYRGGRFGALCLPMTGSAAMWLLLPDEDSSLQELIDGGEAAALLSERYDWADRDEYLVHLSLPKFDVSYDVSLLGALQSMGVRDVFNAQIADFTPLTDKPLELSQAQHAARVKIDEEGCEAAAFTVMAPCEAAAPEPDPEELDFVCDRPFLFAVTGQSGVLFLGAVNDPTA